MKQQSDLSEMMRSPQTEKLLKDKQAMQRLLEAGETGRLMEMLNRDAGGALQGAAQSAMRGEPARLMELIEGIMKNPEAVRMVEQLNRNLSK